MLSTSFSAQASAGTEHENGRTTFGFDVDSNVQLQNLRSFEASRPVIDAITTSLGEFIIPRDASDLQAIPEQACVSVSGSGILTLTATVELEAAPNPLAIPGLPSAIPEIGIRSRQRFAGNRESVLARDGHRCRVCGGRDRVGVHHRRPGFHERDLLISVCIHCHARLHRLAALRRWVPSLLAELWQEVHPGMPVQLQFGWEASA